MKTSIKDIREQAKAIKEGGVRGEKAWKRLENYVINFSNIFEMWGELRIQKGDRYISIYEIIKCDYFF